MVKNDSNPKNQPFLFTIRPNVIENAINPKQVLSPLPTTVQLTRNKTRNSGENTLFIVFTLSFHAHFAQMNKNPIVVLIK